MDIFLTRIFIFTFLPVLVAAVQIVLDKATNTRERKLEVMLLYLFGLGVAGSGIGGFISHFFISDLVAESIGWPAGNPFQLEVAFANLAMGVLGIVSVERRDGFREATVVAATIFAVGATIVHMMDIFKTGNMAPGNTLQNIANLIRPALLIGFLTASRRAERIPGSELHLPGFEVWRRPRAQAIAMLTVSVASGFGLGFAIGQIVLFTFVGLVIGAGLVLLAISRANQATQVGVVQTHDDP